jgi:hypothetical protein
VARAHPLHLIWHRRLGIDLAAPLTGRSGVWLATGGACLMAGLVRLSAGARLMLDGAEWEVEECLPQCGRAVLRGAGGRRRLRSCGQWDRSS